MIAEEIITKAKPDLLGYKNVREGSDDPNDTYLESLTRIDGVRTDKERVFKLKRDCKEINMPQV